MTDSDLVTRRRQQIGDAALDLFGRQGFHQTTMQEIAAKAGVSPGLIYQYCDDKHDVLLMVLLRTIDEYRGALAQAADETTEPLARFAGVFGAYCRTVASMSEATILIYRSTNTLPPERRHVVRQSEAEANRIVADCLQSCVDTGIFRKVDTALTAYAVTMYAHSWALKNWAIAELASLNDYIEGGLQMFMGGLMKAPDPTQVRRGLAAALGRSSALPAGKQPSRRAVLPPSP